MAIIAFAQHYYAHCRTGHSTVSGWQSKAQSEGIDATVRRLLEGTASLYRIPKGNDQRDVENQPVSFRSFPLDSDRWCISQTQYVGESVWQRGRWGVHFTHNLVCSMPDLAQIEGNPFRVRRTGEFVKDDSSDRTELDVLSVEPPPTRLTEVFEAFRQALPDPEQLPNLINALLFANDEKRPVILILPHEKVSAVMEGLICLLPLSIRLSTAFSTYEWDANVLRGSSQGPANRPDFITCIATLPPAQSNLRLTETEYRNRYFIFNFEGNRFSEVPQQTAYTNWICRKLLENADEIEDCHRFLMPYDEFSVEQIDSALSFYQLGLAIKERDDVRMDQGLDFARLNPAKYDPSKPTHFKQIENSLAQLASAYEVAMQSGDFKYPIRVLNTMLEIAVKLRDANQAEIHNEICDRYGVYDTYMELLKALLEAGRDEDSSALIAESEKLPRQRRIRLPIDLDLTRRQTQYFIALTKAALGLLASDHNADDEEALYQACLKRLEASLDAEDDENSKRLFNLVREFSPEKRIDLTVDLSSSRGRLKFQFPLIEQALDGLQVNASDHLMARVYRKFVHLFTEALQRKAIEEALALMKDVYPKLPDAKQQNFENVCFNNQLQNLLNCRIDSSEKGAEFFGLWFPKALEVWMEYESLFHLDSKLQADFERLQISRKLRNELGNQDINNVHIWVEEKAEASDETEAHQSEWLLVDGNGQGYPVRKEDEHLHVYRYNTTIYEQKLGQVLQFMIERTLEDAYGSTLLPILQKELERGRLANPSTQLLSLLCEFVGKANQVKDRAAIYVRGIFPLVRTSDDSEILKTSIRAAARIFENENVAKGLQQEMDRFLVEVPFALDIVTELYPDEAENTLFQWYWLLLERQAEHSVRSELIALYQEHRDALFLRLFNRGYYKFISQDNSGFVNLIRALEPVRGEFYKTYLPEILNKVYQEPKSEFVEQLSKVFKSMKIDSLLPILGRRCAQLIVPETPLSKTEERVISQWVAWARDEYNLSLSTIEQAVNSLSSQQPPDTPLIAKVFVFKELQRLAVIKTPKGLLETDLPKFQVMRHLLTDAHFAVATKHVYRKLAQLSPAWVTVEKAAWNVVEEVARKNEGGLPSPERIRDFFRSCRVRFDYPDILASGTLRWMRSLDEFEQFGWVLARCYDELEKKEQAEYRKRVDERLKPWSKKARAEEYPALEDWEVMIGRKKRKERRKGKGLKRLIRFGR